MTKEPQLDRQLSSLRVSQTHEHASKVGKALKCSLTQPLSGCVDVVVPGPGIAIPHRRSIDCRFSSRNTVRERLRRLQTEALLDVGQADSEAEIVRESSLASNQVGVSWLEPRPESKSKSSERLKRAARSCWSSSPTRRASEPSTG